jgi:hypothetical protein
MLHLRELPVRLRHVSVFLSLNLLLGCTSGKGEVGSDDDTASPIDTASTADTAAWWEYDVDESGDGDTDEEPSDDEDDKPDDGDDGDDKPDDTGDKPDDSGWDSEIEDCLDDFDPEAPCEGDWTTTMCMHDGMIWWCEEGAWMNEGDKP